MRQRYAACLPVNEWPSLGHCPLITLSLHERPSVGGIVCCVLLLYKEVFCFCLFTQQLLENEGRARLVLSLCSLASISGYYVRSESNTSVDQHFLLFARVAIIHATGWGEREVGKAN